MDKLQDIMPNETILIDYFKYIYIVIFLILVFVSFIFIIKKITRKEKIILTKEQKAIKKLKVLDLNSLDSKQILYDFTILSKECLSHENEEKLKKILEKIEPLKYQRNKITLDENLKKILKEYINDLVI